MPNTQWVVRVQRAYKCMLQAPPESKSLACQKAELPALPAPCLLPAPKEVLLEPSCLPNQGYKDSHVPSCKVSFTAGHPSREREHQDCQRLWRRSDKWAGRECEGANEWEWGARDWQRSLWERTNVGRVELNSQILLRATLGRAWNQFFLCFNLSLFLFYSDFMIFHTPVADRHLVISLTAITLSALVASPFWPLTFP